MISVIVLTWNRMKLLKETLSSILDQTFPDFEVLIVDNESTDGTEEYVKRIGDDRVKYFRHPNRGIISVNRNFALEKCRGGFIAFCDDDDLWEPQKLETQMRVFERYPQVAMVCSNGLFFSEKGFLGHLIKRDSDGRISLDDLLSGRNDIVMSSAMFRREILSEVGKWEEDPEIFTVEDYNLWVRIAAKRPIYFINQSLVRIRVHEAMSSHKDTRVMMSKVEKMFALLYEQKILTEEQFQRARRNARQRYRTAALKELVKKLPLTKKTVDFWRRASYALRAKKEHI
jgi:glycosyltransferase involved in cell wall biosynthesis